MNANLKAVPTAALLDPFGRKVSYLRVSVTDRCNLRCTYCMAEDMTFLKKSHVLSLEELEEVCTTFVELGVQKIRLTGGEPLVRNGVEQLIENLGRLNALDELTMTTNGVLLEKHLPAIVNAGVKRINVSLDALDDEVFAKLSRADQLQKVLSSLKVTKEAGIKIRLNTVVLKGENQDQIMPLVDYAVENGFDIAFIEEMPLGNISSHQREETMTLSHSIEQQIESQYELIHSDEEFAINAGPARYIGIKGKENSRIGFISPHSNNFCGSCNRVRLTVEGQLLLCLGNENAVDLRAVLRDENYSRECLKTAILAGIAKKPKQHEFNIEKTHIVRFMNMTGG